MEKTALKKVEKDRKFFRTAADREGKSLAIEPIDSAYLPRLQDFYRRFEPKIAAQGLPPADETVSNQWIEQMLRFSFNIIARSDAEILGHGSLTDIEFAERCELWVAVDRKNSSRGIGGMIVGLLVEACRDCHYKKIWLSVDLKNEKAIHIYRKHGFVFTGPFDLEREMELLL